MSADSQFNIDFISKELKIAANIKDRENRQCVQRNLKRLLESLKAIKWLPKNGLVCFVGIDSSGCEILFVESPYSPIRNFIYRCGSKFETEAVLPLFEEKETKSPQGSLIVVNGNQTAIYHIFNAENSPTFTRITRIEGNLISRQKKGGQSSVRFARLAEDSRRQYVNRIISALDLYCIKMSLDVNILVGGREIRGMVYNQLPSQNKKNFQVVDLQIDDHIRSNQKELIQAFIQVRDKCTGTSDAKRVQSVLEYVVTSPDLICFGKDIEANAKECEYIVSIEGKSQEGDIVIPKSSPFYARLCPYQRIGKFYFALKK